MGKVIELIKKLFFDKTFFKFVMVGVINTLFGTAVMFGCYNFLKLNYWISSAANYFFGSILSFFLNKYFTFRNTEKGFKPILRFALNIIACYTLAYGVAKPLVGAMLSNASPVIKDNGAMLVGMGFFVLLNYFGQRFFAFSEKEEQVN